MFAVWWLVLAPAIAAGQPAPSNPSPVAPGTLRAPVFDTTTPVYDTSNPQQQSANTVVAEVDGRPITLGEVADAIKELPSGMQSLPYPELFSLVQERLVQQQALVIRAQRQGLDEDPVARRRIKAASDRALANELLRQEGMREITEHALLDRYNKDFAGKPGAEEAHVLIIMAPTEVAAQGILSELQSGADFGALAKRSSQDVTASSGGDLGSVTRDGINPELSAVVFATQAGQVAPSPVQSNGGWFVIKVLERRKQPTPSFAAARDQLVQTLLREHAPEVAKRALADVMVRIYSVGGKEMAALPSDKEDAGGR